MASAQPSTAAWILVHVCYPLLPVGLEGFIRLAVANWQLTIDTFSAITLSVSIGLLSVFVNQSIRRQNSPLPDSTETDAQNSACVIFMAFGIIFFVLFALVVLLHALAANDNNNLVLGRTLGIFQQVVLVSWVGPVVGAFVAQRSFKLRALTI